MRESIQQNALAAPESFQKKAYAIFIAVLPVLMMYRVPGIGLGLSTTAIILGGVYAGCGVFRGIIRSGGFFRLAKITIPFILYFLYATWRSVGDRTNALQCLLIIVHILAIAAGCVDLRTLKKAVVGISMLASLLVLVQTFFYYAVRIHIPFIIPSLCIKSLSDYSYRILTGFTGVDSMYRPSAFFLEASHFTQYVFVALLVVLFHGKTQYKPAIFISIGVLATTSGMGIVLVAGIWLCFFLKSAQQYTFGQKIFFLSFVCIIMLGVFVVLYQIPFFNAVISRFVGPIDSSGGYNAIWGRTVYWDAYIAPMSSQELLLGFGYAELPEKYFTGLMELIYCSGILGVIFYYMMFLCVAVWSSGTSRLMALIICGLMTIANLTSFINLTYYIAVILCFSLEDETTQDIVITPVPHGRGYA